MRNTINLRNAIYMMVISSVIFFLPFISSTTFTILYSALLTITMYITNKPDKKLSKSRDWPFCSLLMSPYCVVYIGYYAFYFLMTCSCNDVNHVDITSYVFQIIYLLISLPPLLWFIYVQYEYYDDDNNLNEKGNYKLYLLIYFMVLGILYFMPIINYLYFILSYFLIIGYFYFSIYYTKINYATITVSTALFIVHIINILLDIHTENFHYVLLGFLIFINIYCSKFKRK